MKRIIWVIFLVLALLLAACSGQAVQPTISPTTTGGQIFQIALPRLVIDVDSQGTPSILGISPAILKAVGIDTSGFQVPVQTVDTMTKAGIQHIEIASVGDRLVVFVNGQPMPHLGWTQDSLSRVLDLAAKLDVQNAALLSKLLPMITRLGLDVVLRFPSQPGVAEIPLTEPGAAKNLQITPNTGPASLIVKFEVVFDANGLPGIMGLSAADLQALGVTGLPQLSADLIQKLQKGDIQSMEFRTKPDGAYFYANGDPLPTLIWDSKLLANLVDVYAKISPDAPLLPLIQNTVPYMDRADIDILLHFPLAADATPIPVKMHD